MNLSPTVSCTMTSVKRHDYPITCGGLRPFVVSRPSVCYISQGSGTMIVEDAEYEIKPGGCFLLSPSMKVEARFPDMMPVSLYFVHYAGVVLDSEGRVLPSGWTFAGPDRVALHTENSDIPVLFEQLLLWSRDLRRSAAMKCQSLFQELLYVLQEELDRDLSSGCPAIQRIVDFMERGYMKAIDVGRLPQLAGLTPSSFCRAFKRTTGLTPGGYLSQLRVRKAKELLARPDRTLKEVARSVGFQDELYFSRVFKKSEGVSPALFRKKYKQRIAIVSHLFLQDHLLSLGIAPLAAPSFPSSYAQRGFPSYLQGSLQGTIPLNAERRIHQSDVTRLEPDLIIKMSFLNNPYDDSWSGTSGMVFFEGFPNWTGYMNEIASMVGKENEAERIASRMKRMEEKARDALLPFTRQGKWAVIRVMPDDLRLYSGSSHSFTDLLYRGLGFEPCELASNFSYKPHALDELARMDPERLLVVWSDPEAVERLSDDPLWQGLRAVKQRQVYIPDSVEWDAWGPLGRERTIRACVDYFAKLV